MNLTDILPLTATQLHELTHKRDTSSPEFKKETEARLLRLKPFFEMNVICAKTCGTISGDASLDVKILNSMVFVLDYAIEEFSKKQT